MSVRFFDVSNHHFQIISIAQLLIITRYHVLLHLFSFFSFSITTPILAKASVQTTYGSPNVRVLVASFYARYHTPDVAQQRRVIMRKLFLWWIRERYAITKCLRVCSSHARAGTVSREIHWCLYGTDSFVGLVSPSEYDVIDLSLFTTNTALFSRGLALTSTAFRYV